MEALFPDGLARRRQLIEMVRTFDASVPRLHEQEASSSSLTGAPSRSARMRARARDGGRERGSRSGMRLIATALVVVVALLGGYAIAELTRERPGAAAVSATASSPTSTELGGVNVLDDAPPPVAVQPAPPSAAMVPPPEVTTALDAQTPDEVDTNSRSDPESRRGAARARARAATHARTEPAATAPAPSASPPPAANATGVANIVTPGGWANIYDAEGRYLGQTPIRVTLPAGRHVLQARPFGQPAARRIVVNVTAGATARVVERLGE